MTTLRSAAQQALEALYEETAWFGPTPKGAAAITALRAALAEPTTCAWHGDEDGAYETSCKHIFQMLDGTPQENNFTHCCFCGKSMVQHLWEENNDD